MNGLLQDIRYAFRQLRRSPGFTTVAVLTLTLGIAVNATMFSLVSAFLLQRPPGDNPQRIVVISSVSPGQGFLPEASPVSVPNYLAWREANHAFSDLAAADESRTVNIAASQGRPESLNSAAVSPNYFRVLGISPEIGRAFLPGEDQPGRDHVVILSHDLWKRRFGSDPTILQRTMRINREDYAVVGVMPADFRLMGFTPQLWTPLVLSAADRAPAARKERALRLFARLKPGATLGDACAELTALAQSAEIEFPETEKGWSASVRTLQDFLIYYVSIRSGLVVMMTAVGFVLMIACANVAGLFLARAIGRQKEVGLRISLGASRLRIVRQLLSEGLLIALAGGAAGLLFANWGIQFVRANLDFNEVIRAIPVSLDRNVLFFTVGVSLASALLSGLVPALSASRVDVNSSLKDESRGASAGRSQSRLRAVLVAGQIALALFLLVGSGLLIRGIFLIEHQDLGFRSDHLLTAGVTLDAARYQDAAGQTRFVQNLLLRLRQLPSVETVAAASVLPAAGPGTVTLQIHGRPDLPVAQRPSATHAVVTVEYFRAAGIPLLGGRAFTETDNSASPLVVLVNQEFVRRYFATQDPLGKQILLDLNSSANAPTGNSADVVAPRWSEIVGVVADVKTFSEQPDRDPAVYESFLQRPVPSFSLMLHTGGDPNVLAPSLRDAVSQIDAELPLAQVMSMSSLIELQRYGNPFFSRVLGGFALLALILAAIGVYGLIAYSVGLRTREIGVRMALGARSLDVLSMILREGLRTAAIGGLIGLAISMVLPKAFDALFYGFHFREPALYFIIPVAILVVAALATYIPARRASRIDPMIALRYE